MHRERVDRRVGAALARLVFVQRRLQLVGVRVDIAQQIIEGGVVCARRGGVGVIMHTLIRRARGGGYSRLRANILTGGAWRRMDVRCWATLGRGCSPDVLKRVRASAPTSRSSGSSKRTGVLAFLVGVLAPAAFGSLAASSRPPAKSWMRSSCSSRLDRLFLASSFFLGGLPPPCLRPPAIYYLTSQLGLAPCVRAAVAFRSVQ